MERPARLRDHRVRGQIATFRCIRATQREGLRSMLMENQFGAPGSVRARGRRIVQTAHPRDVAALVLVVGVFLILFVVSVMLGSPPR
jgi:hypothetical protein